MHSREPRAAPAANSSVHGPYGEYRDRVVRWRGPAVDSGWKKNVVVDQCRELLAAFMLGGTASGIQFMALGRGDPSWDATPPPPPSAATNALVDATPIVVPVGDLTVTFLDAVGVPASTPSHRLQVSLELSGAELPITGEQTYPLREFALFGRLGTTPYMIDYVRHGVLPLGTSDTLSRRVRFVF